ncbi:MAG: RiPP maturation radical SAM C-methyltransferase [Nannocystaceae bacterium]
MTLIALVHMPFGSVTYPNLALGQFKAQLACVGMGARVYNFNLAFARMIGVGAYETIARFKGVETQISEWLFAREAWGEELDGDVDGFLRLCGEELTMIPRVTDVPRWLRLIREEVVGTFLDRCVAKLVADAPEVVALSCTFFQTIAALALGQRLRSALPNTRLAYGGACFHGEMGEELFAKIPWIDTVSTGEADDVFVPLMRALVAGERPEHLAGVLSRDRVGAVYRGPPARAMTRQVLENLPDPDFDDFFHDARAVAIDSDASWRERVFLPFEASRGCWWGQKHHCTFCGLNAEGMAYRAKTSARVEQSIRALASRYPVHRMHATDNILAIEHIRELLPRLADNPVETSTGVDAPLKLFFEVKANMTRAQIALLRDAGVLAVQPGLESLSTHHLELMGKGVTALQNVFFLKCAREYGLNTLWNILIRLPGEKPEDYEAMARWIPALTHLQPPSGGAPLVECHRFSPYFTQRGRWIENLRPMPWYRGLFPADIDLERVAYYFEADWKDTLKEAAYNEFRRLTLAWSERWRTAERAPDLTIYDRVGELEIVDTRGEAEIRWTLEGERARVYTAIGDPMSLHKVSGKLLAAHGQAPNEAVLRGCLDEFVDAGLALVERGRYLALGIPASSSAPSASVRRVRLRRVVNQSPPQAIGRRLPVLPTEASG